MDIIKYTLLLLHIVAGISATISTIFLVQLSSQSDNWEKLKKWSTYDLLLNIIVAFAGGLYYLIYYPESKSYILSGSFSIGHHFFMEVKEHLFFIVFLLSIYLNILYRQKYTISLLTYCRKLTITMLVTGLTMSFFGIMTSIGTKTGMHETVAEHKTQIEILKTTNNNGK